MVPGAIRARDARDPLALAWQAEASQPSYAASGLAARDAPRAVGAADAPVRGGDRGAIALVRVSPTEREGVLRTPCLTALNRHWHTGRRCVVHTHGHRRRHADVAGRVRRLNTQLLSPLGQIRSSQADLSRTVFARSRAGVVTWAVMRGATATAHQGLCLFDACVVERAVGDRLVAAGPGSLRECVVWHDGGAWRLYVEKGDFGAVGGDSVEAPG